MVTEVASSPVPLFLHAGRRGMLCTGKKCSRLPTREKEGLGTRLVTEVVYLYREVLYLWSLCASADMVVRNEVHVL